jgi:type 1 glutamine amidotransferase
MNRICRLALAAGLVAAMGFGPARQEKIKLLIIDGQNNHDWVATTSALKASLAKAGRFEVDVSTSPPAKSGADAWSAWRPSLSKYAVLVLNYNGEEWPGEVKAAFVKYVEGGGGAVSVHAANNAFAGWPEYNKMIGLGWRDAGYGDRVTLDDAGKPVRTPKGEGPGAGHGPQHEFVVTVRAPDHPIMKGIPARWLHGKDELYHGQRGPAQNMTILDSAYADKAKGGTGTNEPITWFIPYGKGKVVTTVLGHHMKGQADLDALHCVGFQTILARSAEWVATGKVTIPVPSNFPAADKTSIAAP